MYSCLLLPHAHWNKLLILKFMMKIVQLLLSPTEGSHHVNLAIKLYETFPHSVDAAGGSFFPPPSSSFPSFSDKDVNFLLITVLRYAPHTLHHHYYGTYSSNNTQDLSWHPAVFGYAKFRCIFQSLVWLKLNPHFWKKFATAIHMTRMPWFCNEM